MKKLFTLFLALIATVGIMQAAIQYECNFESDAARNRWVLNPAANQSILNHLSNKWYIGEPGNNERIGHYGLYISDDNGQTAHYTATGCWVFAYDTISLPYMASDDYTLYFDWCAMGNMASMFDGLYVLWIPMTEYNEATGQNDSKKVLSIPTSTGSIPSTYENYVLLLQPTAMMENLNGTATWKQCAVKIKGNKCDGTPHYLAFVWANTNNLAQQPGAMIDNIVITDNTLCEAPKNLTVTPNGTTVTLSWQGAATEYEVSAYSYDGLVWFGPKIVQGTATSFTGLPIGQTDFIVRAKCSDGSYSLKTIMSQLIYYPDQMCVDYLNLNKAKCYVNNSSPNNSLTFNDFRQVSPVDYGPSSIMSRHTIHFDRNEFEPRTGGMAKTVPDGELASVRLGNWEADNHAERIEYTFYVDTVKYPVLLLKYLPILEAPGHEASYNPRLKIDILINGQSIGGCAQLDINADDVLVGGNGNVKPEYAAQGWHKTSASVSQTSADIVWKEWTTVGINLKRPEYQGKKITIRLTTHDCVFAAHCGYAYFAISGSDGKLKGMKCGEINPDFVAPDGFNYRWAYASSEKYRRADGSLPEQYILSRDQQYYAGYHDDSLYVVDCMFMQDSTCFFSLYASILVTEPIAQMNEPQIIKNKQDRTCTVTFDASPSWVREINHVTGDTLVYGSSHIDSYEWNIDGLPYGWSNEVSPTFTLPLSENGYNVTLRVTSGSCESLLYYHLDCEYYKIHVNCDSVQGTVDVQNNDINIFELNAIPNYGYHFTQWSDGNTDNPRTIVLTQDSTITAEFAINSYSIAVSCDSIFGSIEGESGMYAYLTELVYTVASNYGYHFVQWSDGNTDNPRTIVVTEDEAYTAIFAKNIYEVTKQCNSEHGSISGVSQAEYLDSVTLTAIPNADYHFVQWSDGETANPRTFILTQDTIFGAVFAKDTTGLCGKDYALTWSYDSKSQTLTISGAGAFNEHMECGLEAKANMTTLIINEGVTIIGANAFSGCANLTFLQLPTSLKNIGERAFANCSELISIYNYRERPGIVNTNTFEGVNKFDCTLYVLAGSIAMYRSEGSNWKDFYFIEPIESSQTTEPITDVDVDPSDNNAIITWPTSDGAATYTIQITKDGVVVCTLLFNANGQLIGIAFAPSGNDGAQAPSAIKTNNGGLRFTVTGLESGTYYNLTVTAKDTSDNVIDSYSANFTTTGENNSTDIENPSAKLGESCKILRNGRLLILRGDKTYTVTGQEIK